MKKLYVTLFLSLFCIFVSAQVGVNTQNPIGIFHVDSQSNTNGTNNTTDDVVITNSGNVGIGTTTPQTKLEVNGKIRIKDGSEANGKVLVSDADGKGVWQKVGRNGETSLWTITNSTGMHFPVSDNPSKLTGVSELDPDNEVGLTLTANDEVIVPQGLYFIIVEHDLTQISEYGDFQIRTANNSATIYTIYYKEKLSGGSFIYNFTADTTIMAMAGYRNINVAGYTRYSRNTSGTHTEPFITQIRFIRLR